MKSQAGSRVVDPFGTEVICFKGSSSFEFTADPIARNGDTMCTVRTFTIPSVWSASFNYRYEDVGVVRAQISVLKSEMRGC